MKAVSLFSGCGGSDLGASAAGLDIIMANDLYGPSARTYRKYKSKIASDDTDFREGDVAEIEKFPKADCVIGCYPCQSWTMGGPRDPRSDPRSKLYQHFVRALEQSQPKFFVAENVAGMHWLDNGRYLKDQLEAFRTAGKGYLVTALLLNGKDYGLAADRKRIFLVGVRRDLGLWYHFPAATHGAGKGLLPYASHGEAIKALGLGSGADYYQEGSQPFSWWYMSRNRRRAWTSPGYTVVANWRHVTLHPGSPVMELVESNLADGSFQRWIFTDAYDADVPAAFRLEKPRRLTWKECSLLQSFPADMEHEGTLEEKFWQIGNAVPPMLMEAIVKGIVSEESLRERRPVGDRVITTAPRSSKAG